MFTLQKASGILEELKGLTLKLNVKANDEKDQAKVDELDLRYTFHYINHVPGVVNRSCEIGSILYSYFNQYVSKCEHTGNR